MIGYYFKLLKPPTPKFIDKLTYLLLCLLTATLVVPISILRKKTIKQSIFVIFPNLMPKDILISFMGVKFITRKGKTDILILNELSEPWMKHYFKPSKGDVVIDVGAHVGKYSLYAAKLVGANGKVIAIEAHPENFKALRANISLNGFQNITPLNFAAYNKDYEKLLLSGSRDDEYSLKSELIEGNNIEVEARTIDSILQESDIETANWVKIDVEGAEVEVLEGMKELIENSPNLKILVEAHGENINEVDRCLEGFKKECLGGDNPNVPVIFYWRE